MTIMGKGGISPMTKDDKSCPCDAENHGYLMKNPKR
jgi:hypothetical protein